MKSSGSKGSVTSADVPSVLECVTRGQHILVQWHRGNIPQTTRALRALELHEMLGISEQVCGLILVILLAFCISEFVFIWILSLLGEMCEDKWKQEIKEKEQMLALLAEKTRKAGRHKVNLKAELSGLRQKMELDRNLKKDEVEWFERELSRLQMFHQLSNVSLEGDTFLYNGVEVTSLERSEHWNCMICSVNEVSVVFLPCTHQLLCGSCYEGISSCSGSRRRCPCCGVEIEQCIKAYAPS